MTSIAYFSQRPIAATISNAPLTISESDIRTALGTAIARYPHAETIIADINALNARIAAAGGRQDFMAGQLDIDRHEMNVTTMGAQINMLLRQVSLYPIGSVAPPSVQQ